MAGRWPEILAAKNGVHYRPAGVIFTANGTGSADPFLFDFPNFPGMLGHTLENVADGMWLHQPCGYPALTFPMRRSYLQGVDQMVNDVLRHEATTGVAYPEWKIVLSGYSQGALVSSTVWRDEFLSSTGRLRHLKDRVVSVIEWGSPMRCFPPGTLVRMADGSERPIEDVRLGEYVATAQARAGRVVSTMQREESRPLLRLKVWGHSHLRTTPEHPILTRRGYVRADELVAGDEIAFPRYLPEGKSVIKPADYGAKAKAYRSNYKALPEKIELDARFGRLIGLFLAEGSCQSESGGGVRWDFHEDERDTLAAEVVSALSTYGVEAKIRMRSGRKECEVVLYSRGWARLFSAVCGQGASEKRLHPDLTNGPRDFLEAVLSGWLDGDGNREGLMQAGTTVSHHLAMAMYDIAQGLGFRPIISTRKRHDVRGWNTRPEWKVMFSTDQEKLVTPDEWKQAWLSSRSSSGVPGVTYRKTHRGAKKWHAQLTSGRRPYFLERFLTHEEAVAALDAKLEELFQEGKLHGRRGSASRKEGQFVWRKFRGLKRAPYIGPVYDLTVEGDHSYVVEGMGVHNCPNISNGNILAGIPVPGKLDGYTTGGIAGPNCLTPAQTPDFLYSCNNITDLYGSAPVGDDPWHHETEVAYNERLVYEAVMDFDGSDVLAWVKKFAKIAAMPMTQAVPLFEAILNGMRFVGTGFAGHGAYRIDWAVAHLLDLGTRLRHEAA